MSALADLAKGLAAGKIKVVDLTETLSPEFPHISLPPEMGQAWPFRIEEVSHYDERGPAWYGNNFSCGEHTATSGVLARNRSAPTRARPTICGRPTPAITTCTARGATACNACATSISCRPPAPSSSPRRSRSATAAAARCACWL